MYPEEQDCRIPSKDYELLKKKCWRIVLVKKRRVFLRFSSILLLLWKSFMISPQMVPEKYS